MLLHGIANSQANQSFFLQWASAIESLDSGTAGSDKSFGMKQRPDGDIEIDEKFWEEDFLIPTCQKCDGVLKPDVISTYHFRRCSQSRFRTRISLDYARAFCDAYKLCK